MVLCSPPPEEGNEAIHCLFLDVWSTKRLDAARYNCTVYALCDQLSQNLFITHSQTHSMFSTCASDV